MKNNKLKKISFYCFFFYHKHLSNGLDFEKNPISKIKL